MIGGDMIRINDFVDQVYCINLSKRKDRWDFMEKEFKKFSIDVKRINGVDGMLLKKSNINLNSCKEKLGSLGCLRSHQLVYKDALENNYKKICIFEDDIIFCKDFKSRIDYYIRNIPKNWDIMYLGCHFHGCKKPEKITSYIYKNSCSFGAFAYIINDNIIKELYNSRNDIPIDNQLCFLNRKYNAYSFIPFFVKTRKIKSDISNTDESFEYDEVNYLFKDELKK